MAVEGAGELRAHFVCAAAKARCRQYRRCLTIGWPRVAQEYISHLVADPHGKTLSPVLQRSAFLEHPPDISFPLQRIAVPAGTELGKIAFDRSNAKRSRTMGRRSVGVAGAEEAGSLGGSAEVRSAAVVAAHLLSAPHVCVVTNRHTTGSRRTHLSLSAQKSFERRTRRWFTLCTRRCALRRLARVLRKKSLRVLVRRQSSTRRTRMSSQR